MSSNRARKMLLIGWDAADWRIINPLIDAGKMPVLERLVSNGVMGNLATLHPVLSPMLWTSIATGMRPHKHGILGFTEPGPGGSGQRPVTNLSRKVKAIWNILGQSGYRCNVVGWWPSHPVEPIAGTMVSNHFHRAAGALDTGWPLTNGTVHPPELAEVLAECRFHPEEITAEHVLPFVPKAVDVDQDKDSRLASVAKIIAEATSVHSAATYLMDETEWDFMAVYYDAIDHFCHGFMKYHPPRRPFIPERDFELYQGVVEAGYRYHDLMLGTLLAKTGEDTTVIIVSDHGFHPDHMRPEVIPLEPAGPAVEHRDFGIIAMHGPGLRRDEIIHGASLLDVTPTILTLCGLPVGEDMDGKPLVTAFQEPCEITRIPSWEAVAGDDGRHPPEMQFDVTESREAMEQLVALGYVEAPDENAATAAQGAIREQRFNRARSLMNGAQHAEAVPILEALRSDDLDEMRFGINLAMCYRALGRIEELRSLVEELIERRRREAERARIELQEMLQERREQHAGADSPDANSELARDRASSARLRKLRQSAHLDQAALDFLMGFVLAAEGDAHAALDHLRRAEKSRPGRPVLHVQIGETYLQLEKWEDAERSFVRATEIDAENPHAELGISRSLLPRRQNRRAAESALRAVALLHEYPMAHYCLGVALHRMGHLDRAVQALEVAVAQNPNFLEAHERLAKIFRKRLRDPDRAEPHEKLAVAIRYGIRPDEPAQADSEAPRSSAPSELTFPSLQPDPRVDPSERITVVSGLPRSGTSLMMQMLAAGGFELLSDGEREPDEDNPRGYFELERVRALRSDSSWVGEARGKVIKVIAQLLPFLPHDLPYQVIFMQRNLDEVIASQARMLRRTGATGATLEEGRLAAAFERQLEQVRGHLVRREVPTRVVEYRDAVEAPERVATTLAEFLGRELDRSAMVRAVDPELYRNRTPDESVEG